MFTEKEEKVFSLPRMSFEEIRDGFANIEDIENLEDELWSMAFDEFEPYEAAKSVRADMCSLQSFEEYDVLNKFFIGIFGWSLETLLKRVQLKERGEI